MNRSLLRVVPDLYERKALGKCKEASREHPAYTAAQAVAYVGALCLAESQTPRGYFPSAKVLAALLEGDGTGAAYAAEVPFLIEQGDLVPTPDGLYVEGWRELQEGDWTVAERMRRYRQRRNPDADNLDLPPEDDPAVLYMQIVGSFPRGRAIEWIDDLQRQFGSASVCSALQSAASSGTTDLLRRASDALRMKERAAKRREEREEEERVAEKRKVNVPLLTAQHNTGQHVSKVAHCPYCEQVRR